MQGVHYWPMILAVGMSIAAAIILLRRFTILEAKKEEQPKPLFTDPDDYSANTNIEGPLFRTEHVFEEDSDLGDAPELNDENQEALAANIKDQPQPSPAVPDTDGEPRDKAEPPDAIMAALNLDPSATLPNHPRAKLHNQMMMLPAKRASPPPITNALKVCAGRLLETSRAG